MAQQVATGPSPRFEELKRVTRRISSVTGDLRRARRRIEGGLADGAGLEESREPKGIRRGSFCLCRRAPQLGPCAIDFSRPRSVNKVGELGFGSGHTGATLLDVLWKTGLVEHHEGIAGFDRGTFLHQDPFDARRNRARNICLREFDRSAGVCAVRFVAAEEGDGYEQQESSTCAVHGSAFSRRESSE